MAGIDTIELFPVTEAGPLLPAQSKDPEMEGLSPGRRRTIRRLRDIARGVHPITGLPLHEDAPEDASRRDRFVRATTCGSCVHRMFVGGHAKDYPKCDLRVTASEATDCPRWLPGCSAWKPVEE